VTQLQPIFAVSTAAAISAPGFLYRTRTSFGERVSLSNRKNFVLSKCFNPGCSTPFRYLRDGRIYHLDIPAPAGSARRREFFWLCGHCCATLTVIVKEGAGAVQPRFRQLVPTELFNQAEEESLVP
jgi:hypothetical protein